MLAYWILSPEWPVCSHGVPAEVGGWDKTTSWGKQVRRGKYMVSIGDGIGRMENGGFLLQSWKWDWRIGSVETEGEVKICI